MNGWDTFKDVCEHITKGYYKAEGRYFFRGIPITVEDRAGTVRFRMDRDKIVHWRTVMRKDYGYIRGTVSAADGDALDCFVNTSNPNSEKVFIIHQKDPKTGGYDEDKVMLGFDSEDDAVREYKLHYDDGDAYFGSVTEMSLERFKIRISGKNSKRLPMLRSWRKVDNNNYGVFKKTLGG